MKKSLTGVFLTSLVVTATICAVVVVFTPTESQEQEEPTIDPPHRSCVLKVFDEGFAVCVCNSSYCDTVPQIPTLSEGDAVVYTSSKAGKRFEQGHFQFNKTSKEIFRGVTFSIDSKTARRFQSALGFGGAFTDAATINIAKLSESSQEHLLASYFSPQGIEYNLGRIPMASCDFSTRLYTYADEPNDFAMKNFSLAMEDLQYKIPIMKRAMAMNKKEMKLFASPWSAPSWMKTNGALYGGGSLIGEAGDKYHQAWALYFARFVEEYERNGVHLWGLTAQNEPIDGFSKNFSFQCMGFTPEQQRDFIKLDLGPTLRERGHGNLHLMIGDDQRMVFPQWAKVVLNDSDVAQYVSGIGVHWYMDMLFPPSKLVDTHESFPDYFILNTEACTGAIPFIPDKVQLGNWERGQRYSIDIIQDLNHWVTGWVDWNLALDLQGGPNWAKNFVDAPIIVNGNEDEFYKQPMFYHMGHFSKFIPEGATRIQITGPSDLSIKYVAFLHDDNTTVTLVVLNIAEKDVPITITDASLGAIHSNIPSNSIQTYMWKTS